MRCRSACRFFRGSSLTWVAARHNSMGLSHDTSMEHNRVATSSPDQLATAVRQQRAEWIAYTVRHLCRRSASNADNAQLAQRGAANVVTPPPPASVVSIKAFDDIMAQCGPWVGFSERFADFAVDSGVFVRVRRDPRHYCAPTAVELRHETLLDFLNRWAAFAASGCSNKGLPTRSSAIAPAAPFLALLSVAADTAALITPATEPASAKTEKDTASLRLAARKSAVAAGIATHVLPILDSAQISSASAETQRLDAFDRLTEAFEQMSAAAAAASPTLNPQALRTVALAAPALRKLSSLVASSSHSPSAQLRTSLTPFGIPPRDHSESEIARLREVNARLSEIGRGSNPSNVVSRR